MKPKFIVSVIIGIVLSLSIGGGLYLSRDIPPTPAPIVAPVVTPSEPLFGAGNYALIVYETSQPLPAAQLAILTSPAIRSYMRAAHVNFRILDKDADMTHDPTFAKALQAPRDSLPWLIVAKDGRTLSMPLPKDTPAAMQLLTKTFGTQHVQGPSAPPSLPLSRRR